MCIYIYVLYYTSVLTFSLTYNFTKYFGQLGILCIYVFLIKKPSALNYVEWRHDDLVSHSPSYGHLGSFHCCSHARENILRQAS